MASLIPKEEMTTLKSAAEVKEISEQAELIQEEMSVAATINGAANTGVNSIFWYQRLSKTLKEKLEEMGYTVREVEDAANAEDCHIISWGEK